MKKLFIAVLGLTFFISNANAQAYKKELKEATKLASKYQSNPTTNAASLDEALAKIDAIIATPEGEKATDVWYTKGDILLKAVDADVSLTYINPQHKITLPNGAVDAALAFENALKYAEKKGNVKDATDGLVGVENTLSNIGITHYQNQDNLGAFKNFSKALDVAKILNANSIPSRLDDADLKADIQYYAAICAYTAEVGQEAIPILLEMEAAGTDKAVVYQLLYELYLPTDEAKATEYLTKGRSVFPTDSGLLFAEINKALREGKFEELVVKLKEAIAAEPNNVSVYNTMGNVYEQLMNKEKEAGNKEKQQEYYEQAITYYSQGLAVDIENHDANYSIGALHYNKAANLTEAINEYAQDLSKEGTQKYNDLKKQMDALFDKAFPYFLKASQINPNDLNTLTALREIYVRKGQMDKATEVKNKLDELKEAQGM